jgi:hypothetical protein
MRVGTWVPVYKTIVPIPVRFAVAFGLREGSQLYIGPLDRGDEVKIHGIELLVSPVPPRLWKSVCRLSVRLHDVPGALAIATRFLVDRQINILLTESCVTYHERAHWDAICDLSTCPGYPGAQGRRESYADALQGFLTDLSTDFVEYAKAPHNRVAFLQDRYMDIHFTPLPGLNDTAFTCSEAKCATLTHQDGGVVLPGKIVDTINQACNREGEALPPYAVITGNTEQRYLRIFFAKNHRRIFRAVVENRLTQFAGGGIGAMHGFLSSLPKQVDLIRTSNYIVESSPEVERGYIDMIAYWGHDADPHGTSAPDRGHAVSETDFRDHVDRLVLCDIQGNQHRGCFSVVEFGQPDTIYPRVFISYSTGRAEKELQYLRHKLWSSHFQPIVGTEYDRYPRGPDLATQSRVTRDVTSQSFEIIPGCVAFISLMTPRDDFRVVSTPAAPDRPRHVLPPWTVAEEAFAYACDVGVIIRIKHDAVEGPRYNENVRTFVTVR